MTVSAKVNYAVLAVLILTEAHDSGRPVPLREMSAHGIPSQFLAQIFQQLKAAGIVQSTRGSTGGYRLVAAPGGVTVWDVVSAIEPPDRIPKTLSRLAMAVSSIWNEVASTRVERLQSTTFEDLLRSVEGQVEPMYYI